MKSEAQEHPSNEVSSQPSFPAAIWKAIEGIDYEIECVKQYEGADANVSHFEELKKKYADQVSAYYQAIRKAEEAFFASLEEDPDEDIQKIGRAGSSGNYYIIAI